LFVVPTSTDIGGLKKAPRRPEPNGAHYNRPPHDAVLFSLSSVLSLADPDGMPTEWHDGSRLRASRAPPGLLEM
jgi:hypothetical protein